MPIRLTLISSLLALAMFACQEENAAPACSTLATVRDFTGRDGCGWVLELDDSTYLEPYLSSVSTYDPLWCGEVSPNYQEGPRANASLWYNANLQDGMTVRIAYRVLSDQASICMASDVVEVTCLEVLDRPEAITLTH